MLDFLLKSANFPSATFRCHHFVAQIRAHAPGLAGVPRKSPHMEDFPHSPRVLVAIIVGSTVIFCPDRLYPSAGEQITTAAPDSVPRQSMPADTSLLGSARRVADMNLQELANVRVSPFEVSATLDRGYRPSNSVSGSRFDAPIRELPFALQAFTKSFIADQKPVTLFDVARYSPGVTYRSNDFNEGNANLAIRGFTVATIAGGNIPLMRDGFHGPTIIDFTNISRVEVVKGPASFLYGQLSPGGFVNVITKSPQSVFAATLDVRGGSYGGYRGEADITGPVSESLLYRVSASYDQDMHYWQPYDAHSWDMAPSVFWQPLDLLALSFRYERFRKSEQPQLMQKPGYGPQRGLVPTPADPNLSGVDVPGLSDNWNGLSLTNYRNSDVDMVSAWADVKLGGNWSVRVGYSRMACTIDAIFSGNFGMANNVTRLQGRRVRFQTYENRDEAGQIHAVGKYQVSGMSVKVLLGAEYVDRAFGLEAGQAPNDTSLGHDPTASPLPLWDLTDPSTWDRSQPFSRSVLTAFPADQITNSVDRSIWGGVTLGFFDNRLLMLAGGRFTSTESQNSTHTGLQLQSRVVQHALTPQYGILYKLEPTYTLFASFAESFVPGVGTVINSDGTTSPAKSTEGEGLDIGIKGDLFGGRVSGTLTAFDVTNENIVNDLATTNASGQVVVANVQSGRQRSCGLECDATISMGDGLQVYLSYSYMFARIVEFSGNDDAILARDTSMLDASGRANYRNVKRFHAAPLQMSAPHTANVWGRYDVGDGLLRGLYLAGGASLVFDQTLLPDGPSSAHQTYALLMATVGATFMWGNTPVIVDLTGKNLTGEQYRPSQSTRSRPAEMLLNLSLRF
jgi:iron complex outermembrane recepter protein